MDGNDGLICAYAFDGAGRAREASWEEALAAPEDGAGVWLHFDRTKPDTRTWLTESSGLDPIVAEALLEEETRPRTIAFHHGLFAILRGVNLNPGSDHDDMISIRVWVDARRVITLRYPRLMSIQDIRDSLAEGAGPKSPSDFLIHLVDRLLDRMSDVLEGVDDRMDGLEDTVIGSHDNSLRADLGALRRHAIGLRRYLAPQRDALAYLLTTPTPLLNEVHRMRLRESTDRLLRYVEDLEEVRERAKVTQEELEARHAEQLNRNTYILSIMAGICLPLALLTGLLGINVGGMPGTDNAWAFWIVCALMGVLAGVGIWAFRRLKIM